MVGFKRTKGETEENQKEVLKTTFKIYSKRVRKIDKSTGFYFSNISKDFKHFY